MAGSANARLKATVHKATLLPTTMLPSDVVLLHVASNKIRVLVHVGYSCLQHCCGQWQECCLM